MTSIRVYLGKAWYTDLWVWESGGDELTYAGPIQLIFLCLWFLRRRGGQQTNTWEVCLLTLVFRSPISAPSNASWMWVQELGEDCWSPHLPLLLQREITIVFQGIFLNYSFALQCRVWDLKTLLHLERQLALQRALSEQFMIVNKEGTSSLDTGNITQVNQSSEADCRDLLQDTPFISSTNCLNARHP